MNKLLGLGALLISINVNANDIDWKSLINNNDNQALKTSLYTEKPDVISRDEGDSILDYAVLVKNKRAAIIIAEYHNYSLKTNDINKIYNKIELIKNQLAQSGDLNVRTYLGDTLAVIQELEQKIKKLEADNQLLLDAVSENTVKYDDLIADLKVDVSSLKDQLITKEEVEGFFSDTSVMAINPTLAKDNK